VSVLDDVDVIQNFLKVLDIFEPLPVLAGNILYRFEPSFLLGCIGLDRIQTIVTRRTVNNAYSA